MKFLWLAVYVAVCLVGPPVCSLSAADELDQMLAVEGTSLKDTAGLNGPAPVSKAKAKLPSSNPAAKSVQPVPTNNVPAATPRTALFSKAKPPAAVKGAVEPAVPPGATATESTVAGLRVELMLREQELATANKEVERLKDIVRRIQAAARRESVVLHYNKASVYRASTMYKKAEEEYLAALALDPSDPGVHYNLAILYDDNFKDKKKAGEHYKMFLQLAPNDEDAPKVREWMASTIQ